MAMKRRVFLKATAAAGISALADSNVRAAEPDSALSKTATATVPTDSGVFGEWATDEWGNVAYDYRANQLDDARAITPTDPIFRDSRDHWHQIGNGRIIATASNFGHLQVRQDEGGAKFLNDYIPTEGEFGGGLAWLSDGQVHLSTYFPSAPQTWTRRRFGQGYFEKEVVSAGLALNQTIFAPFGDYPVLITIVSIRNLRASSAALLLTEYWGCRHYEFFASQGEFNQTETHFARRAFAKQFAHSFSEIPNGLMERKTFSGNDDGIRIPGKAQWRDFSPPATFFAALGGPVAHLSSDAR